MPLQPGDVAPDFTLFKPDRTPWTLSEHRGEHVLLLFFPGAFTSVCTAELCSVNDDLGRYSGEETTVVGISTDSPFTLREYAKTYKLTFPLLSDHNGEISARYGAKYDHDFTHMKLDRISRRAAFLVAEDGTIRYAEVLADAEDQPDFDAIHEAMTA